MDDAEFAKFVKAYDPVRECYLCSDHGVIGSVAGWDWFNLLRPVQQPRGRAYSTIRGVPHACGIASTLSGGVLRVCVVWCVSRRATLLFSVDEGGLQRPRLLLGWR